MVNFNEQAAMNRINKKFEEDIAAIKASHEATVAKFDRRQRILTRIMKGCLVVSGLSFLALVVLRCCF